MHAVGLPVSIGHGMQSVACARSSMIRLGQVLTSLIQYPRLGLLGTGWDLIFSFTAKQEFNIIYHRGQPIDW